MTGLEATERAIREHLVILRIVTTALEDAGEALAATMPNGHQAIDTVIGLTSILSNSQARLKEVQTYLAEQIGKEVRAA